MSVNEPLIKKLRLLPEHKALILLPPDEAYIGEIGLEPDAPEAQAVFDKLAPSHKKEYVKWIVEAKRDETRASRIQKTVEKLRAGLKNPYDKG